MATETHWHGAFAGIPKRDQRATRALAELFMALRPRSWRQRLVGALVCSWGGHRSVMLDSGLVSVCRDCGAVEVSREVVP